MPAKIFKNYIYPIAALSGSIIGVGFLSLPYITLQVGMIVMLGYFLAVTVLMVCVNLMTAEISLKTPDHKRFPGFVEYHLGVWPKYIALTSTILGSWGVLLIYLVVSQQFLQGLFIMGSANFWGVMVFFLMAIVAILVGIAVVARIEFWALCFLALSLLVIFFKEFSAFHLSRIALFPAMPYHWTIFLLPYGALIFSLGTSFIPAVEEMV